MAQDFTDLVTTEGYAALLTHIGDRDVALALAFDPAYTTPTNVKPRTVRWNSANGYWEYFNGTVWGALASTYNITVAKANHLAGAAAGAIPYQSAEGVTALLAAGAAGYILKSNGAAAPSWLQTLPVANGGTGAATFASGGLLVGNGTSALGIASAAQIVAAIGTTAVTNATNATNATTAAACSGNAATATTASACSGNAATATMAKSVPTSTTATTLVAADTGQCVKLAAAIAVPAGVFADDDIVSLYNNTAGSLAITQGSGFTLRQVGTANTGNRTLAQRGMATLWFISATEAVISGGGLT